MLSLKTAIQDLPSNEGYVEYKATQTAKVQRDVLEHFEGTICDVSFWEQLKFFHRVMLPAIRALRLMDSCAVRTKDVIRIWESLEDRLIVELLHPDFEKVELELKQTILSLYYQARAAAHRQVFDAAWMLDPANWQKVKELASGQSDEYENDMWATRRENTFATLRTMIKRRMLIKQRVAWRNAQESSDAESSKRSKLEENPPSFILDKERHAEDSYREFETVESEFVHYCAGIGSFSSAPIGPVDSFWYARGSRLNFYAIRLLNMAASISDVERVHKVYSGIHTPERNRLDENRVDRIALARIAFRIFQLPPKPQILLEQLAAFSKTSSEDEQALFDWGELISRATRTTVRTVMEPTQDGVRLDAPIPEDDIDKTSDTALKETNIEITADDEDEAFNGSTTSQAKRKVFVSAKLLGGLRSLRLSTFVE